MLLSIDVGIKNLAMCIMNPEKKIEFWEVGGVPPLHSDGLFLSMKRHLDSKSFEHVTKVLIERQPEMWTRKKEGRPSNTERGAR